MGDREIFDLLKEMKSVHRDAEEEEEEQRRAKAAAAARRQRVGSRTQDAGEPPVDSELLDERWGEGGGGGEEEELVKVSQVGKWASPHNPPTPAALGLEARRWRAMSGCAARFRELAGEVLGKGWARHFEKYLYSARSRYEKAKGGVAGAGTDPCLPSFPTGSNGRVDRIDGELVRKLVAAGMRQDKAESVCEDVARHCTKAIQGLVRAGGGGGQKAGRVSVEEVEMRADGGRRRVKLRLTCCGVSVEINDVHYAKLKRLYERTSAMAGGDEAGGEEDERAAIFRLLARYSSFQGTHFKAGGFQAAIHGECFDVLASHFGCSMECFASPLNARWARYCSAHPDTDAAFGSLGSFFSFRPKTGSFEANPPFDSTLIAQMSRHMASLLAASEEPLCFVVVIPYLPQQEGWGEVDKNPFKAKHLHLPAAEHGYYEGAQHDRINRFRVAQADTSVFWLQNEAGRARWKVTGEALRALRDAFRPKTDQNPHGLKAAGLTNPLSTKGGGKKDVAAARGGGDDGEAGGKAKKRKAVEGGGGGEVKRKKKREEAA